ncbi:NAD(P)-binding domain-containing protein [Stackebrandtia soli]|uniref:NAD(P)-binding domain-containing protein n=1 Tax=Stackebrandtia soli TaxID=1892856 RepID=UPI0039E8BF4E
MTEPTADRQHEYIIIGAGPAGLQLAYFLDRAGLDYVLLEANKVGHFFSELPRHRRLISNNKVHTGYDDRDMNLRWDWNSLLSENLDHLFTEYTDEYFPYADTLVQYLADFRERFALNVREETRVASIGRDSDGGFVVSIEGGEVLRSQRVVVATGHTVPHIPDVPGIEAGEEYSTISTDANEYRNQRVMIVGKGNSGMETAEAIFEHAASVHMLSPNPVRLAWNTHHVSDVRAVYNNVLDSYQLKMQNTILDANLRRVERREDGRLNVAFTYSHANGQDWDLTVDRLILATGFRFDFSIFDDSCTVSTCHDGRWPAMTSSWESTDVPGLYFVGTIMQARDYKKSFSGFIHGFRYNIRFLSELLRERYHGEPRAVDVIECDPKTLADAIVDRADNASSMFQLPAFMSDVYVLDGADGIERHRDTTVAYALDHEPWRNRTLLIATLEYGHLPKGADPFNFPRDPRDGTTSQFIHPVLRLYVDGEHVDTYHVPEDLENEWNKDMYLEPFREALARMLNRDERMVTA